jgi:tetratricopeptide (TPR) repeat protein
VTPAAALSPGARNRSASLSRAVCAETSHSRFEASCTVKASKISIERRQENSELAMARMLEDLETRLKKADQLETLDDAAKKVPAYLKSLDPRDLADRSNTQQAKLFTQIGQIYLARLRYADATESFAAALDRASGLVTRHPRDGEILFERA